MSPPLVLASGSPRRAEILGRLGIAFEVVVPGIDEDTLTAGLLAAGATPVAIALALAVAKAEGVAALRPDARVLAADTLVVLDGTLLGKPTDAAEAQSMLSRLSGRSHEVITGVAYLDPPAGPRTTFESTAVRFARWPAAARAAYIAGGDPFDKAGGYGIQGPAGAFIERIDGCPSNVAGLPLARVRALLESSAMAQAVSPPSGCQDTT
jgi:septum formation protein